MPPTKLILFILVTIFIAFPKGNEADPLEALYEDMHLEMKAQMSNNLFTFQGHKEGEPVLPAKSKLQFCRYICAKIDLLEGIFAELNANGNSHVQTAKEYFLDDEAVKMFLDFVKLGKGGQQSYKAEFFSKKKKSEQFEHFQKWFENGKSWVLKNLIGRTFPLKFLEILENISAMEPVPEKIKSKHLAGIPATYRQFQMTLKGFIDKFKLEIVLGQTYVDFIDINSNIKRYEKQMQEKISNADEIEGLKGKSPAKLWKMAEHNNAANDFYRVKGIFPAEYKKLYLKFKHLNDVSLELYTRLMQEIPEMIKQKVNKESTKLPFDTFMASTKVRRAFEQIMPQPLLNIFDRNEGIISPIGVIFLWDMIKYELFLPDKWLNEEHKLFYGISGLRPSIRLNSAIILLAYERMAKFLDEW